METIKQIEQRHAKELQRAKLDLRLTEELKRINAPIPSLFHHGELYGVSLSWSYGDTFNKPLTIDEAEEIVKALPPVPLAYARGNYRYWIPLELEGSFIEKHESKGEEITEFFEILPYKINIDGFGSKISYFTRILDQLARVDLCLSCGPHLGGLRLTGHVRRHSNHGPISSITGRHITYNGNDLTHDTLDIYNDSDEWCGQFERPVIYAQGTSDSWGNAVMFAHYGGGITASFQDFMRAIGMEQEQAA